MRLTTAKAGLGWGPLLPPARPAAFNPFLFHASSAHFKRPRRQISCFFCRAAVFHLGMCSPKLGFRTVKYLWGYYIFLQQPISWSV